jgi:hypothetical protein
LEFFPDGALKLPASATNACSALLRFSPFRSPLPAQNAGRETRPPAAADQRAAAMEFFPDGAFVRLQSRVRRRYLHADEDGRGVSLSPVRASLNSAWRVHRVVRNDVPFVLLYGAAYGRYLTASNEPAPFGHREKLVVQGVYDHPAVSAVLWTAVEAEQGGGYVLLRHISDRPLRANGRHLSWNNGVTVDHPDSQSTMTHWVVEAIPLLPGAPSLQPQVHTVSSRHHTSPWFCLH